MIPPHWIEWFILWSCLPQNTPVARCFAIQCTHLWPKALGLVAPALRSQCCCLWPKLLLVQVLADGRMHHFSLLQWFQLRRATRLKYYLQKSLCPVTPTSLISLIAYMAHMTDNNRKVPFLWGSSQGTATCQAFPKLLQCFFFCVQDVFHHRPKLFQNQTHHFPSLPSAKGKCVASCTDRTWERCCPDEMAASFQLPLCSWKLKKLGQAQKWCMLFSIWLMQPYLKAEEQFLLQSLLPKK